MNTSTVCNYFSINEKRCVNFLTTKDIDFCNNGKNTTCRLYERFGKFCKSEKVISLKSLLNGIVLSKRQKLDDDVLYVVYFPRITQALTLRENEISYPMNRNGANS